MTGSLTGRIGVDRLIKSVVDARQQHQSCLIQYVLQKSTVAHWSCTGFDAIESFRRALRERCTPCTGKSSGFSGRFRIRTAISNQRGFHGRVVAVERSAARPDTFGCRAILSILPPILQVSDMFRRNPFVRQNDGSDCGAAALATVALYHRMPVDLEQVRDLAGTDRVGTFQVHPPHSQR